MKRIGACVILAVALLGLAAASIWQFAVRREFDARLAAALAVALASCGLTLARLLTGQKQASHLTYRQEYGKILKTAFAEDRLSRSRLYEAIDRFNRDEWSRAVKLLDGLLPRCKLSADFAAVHAFRGLCLEGAGLIEEAIAAYEEAVQYDKWISTVWSNLGLLYARRGDTGKAVAAYEQAIAADDRNPFAYSNLAAAYLRAGKLDDCIRQAEKALEINNNMAPAMSALAVAFRMKGNTEESEKYARLYALNGGDGEQLRHRLREVQAVAPAETPDVGPLLRLLEPTRRPVLRLTLTDTPPALTHSKVGGVPYLPRGGDYPLDAAGRPLRLLCQIECRRCAGLPGFPQRGLLQFFIRPDELYGLDFREPTRQDGFRVLYHATIDPTVTEADVLSRLPPMKEGAVFPVSAACGVAFTPGEELISRDDGDFPERFAQLTGKRPDSLPDEVYDELGARLDASGHKMGGYPAFTQGDPRENGNGGRYDTLLLQLDSEAGAEPRILWGDSGVCGFFIPGESLRRLDFSDVWYSWDCY